MPWIALQASPPALHAGAFGLASPKRAGSPILEGVWLSSRGEPKRSKRLRMAQNKPNQTGTKVPPRSAARSGRPGALGGRARPMSGRQAAQMARNRRRRAGYAAGAVAVVVAVVAVLVVVGLNHKSAPPAPRVALTASEEQALQSVPLDNLVTAANRVSGLNPVQPLSGPPLTAAGKPEVLYIGAEFCPICATERWAMMVALSQFGKFSGVSQTRSAVQDGNIATLSFYKSTYTSPYLDFVPVEVTTNTYKPLENPTPAEAALWKSVEAQFGETQESFPFVDIGGKYVLLTSQFNDTTLEGYSFQQILSQVGNNSTTVGADIDAAAAAFTKYLCAVTGDQPASVCHAVSSINAPVASTNSGPSSANG